MTAPPAPLREALCRDAELFDALRRPGRPPSCWSTVVTSLVSPGLWSLGVHRLSQRLATARPGSAAASVATRAARAGCLLAEHLVQVATRSEIWVGTRFEGRVWLSSRGHIVLGAESVGAGTVIHHRVTIGRGRGDGALPRIGRNAWIGPHSVIYGNVTVGDGATVLPHTVVSRDVPAGALVAGNPPRILRRHFDNAALRRSASGEVGPGVPPQQGS